MRGVNLVVVGGNIGGEIELRYTPSGSAVANFSLAINEKWRGSDGEEKERTTWLNIVVFGKQGEACNEHLKKGSAVLVQGRLVENKWEDQNGNKRSRIEVIANRIDFLMTAKVRDEAPPFNPDDDPPF
jgi:single-strand DNA-binding protein